MQICRAESGCPGKKGETLGLPPSAPSPAASDLPAGHRDPILFMYKDSPAQTSPL